MSFEAVLWATNDAPIANVNEFAVLTMLAEKADPDGCNAFPSRPTVAARTKIDPKTVLRCFQALEARGLIAEGDQRAAEYIRADRRPVVYDLLIPFDWFPNVERINKERMERGRAALTPADRPRIAPAPEKKRRSDLGKQRPKVRAAEQAKPARGDYKSPRDTEGYGVTLSPARGDSQSGTGGLVVTQTSPLNQSVNQPSLSLSSVSGGAQAPGGDERETAAAPKTTSRPAVADVPEQRETSKQDAAAARIVAAYAAALGRPVLPDTRSALHGQALQLLAAEYPEAWLSDRAQELAAHGWGDLVKHVKHSKVTLTGRPGGGAPAVTRQAAIDACSACDEYGQFERDDTVGICKHGSAAPSPKPTVTAGQQQAGTGSLGDLLRSMRQPSL